MDSIKKTMQNNFSLMSFDELEESTCGEIIFNYNLLSSFYFVAIDSRFVKKDSLFVPLRGKVQDGHSYIEQALIKGACCFIVDRVYLNLENNKEKLKDLCLQYKVCCVVVENNLAALQAAAKYYLKKYPNLYRIGITGSSGKTTTKEILASIYRTKYNTVVTAGNLNSETGLPLSVFEVRPEHEVGIFELGTNRIGEINEITNVLLPNAAIITNIGTAHIGIFGTKQKIAEEKKQIFSHFDDSCVGFINDDEFSSYLKDIPMGQVFSVSHNSISNIDKIEDVGMYGSIITYKGVNIKFPLLGVHNLKNALLCIALAEKNNFSFKEIKNGLENVKPLFGRSQINMGLVKYFLDCYNASPETMKCAVEFCDSLKIKGKKHYVLASMMELGDKMDFFHKYIIDFALESEADVLYFFGNEFYNAAVDRNLNLKLGKKLYNSVFFYKTDEFEKLKNNLKTNIYKDDFVLLKGSRAMELERLEVVLHNERGSVM